MNPNEWQAWLAQWLRLHPIKEPPAALQKTYRDEVMARIRAERAPVSVPIRPFVFKFPPRPTFALAGALAGVLVFALLTRPSVESQIQQLEEELQIFAEVTEEELEEFPPEADPVEELLLLEEVELT